MKRSLAQRLPNSLTSLLMFIYRIRRMYFNDGLLSIHNTDFRHDPRFARAARLGLETGSFGAYQPIWRIYISCWAASMAAHVQGDFVECGVNRGGYSRAIVDYVDFARKDKILWLLDTYEGLVPSQISPEEVARGIKGMDYEACYEDVVRTFSPFHNVRIVRGEVPGTLQQVTAEKIAFLAIDMNCAEPEIAAAEHFWERMSPGAIMLLDDYGWAKHEVQKQAFDDFARRRGLEILTLPTGQGLLIKV